MSWTKVLTEDALKPGEREVVKVGDRKILVLNHEGELYAVDNACPHLKLSLKKSKITQDCALVCRWHKSAFDLRTGEVKKWTPWPPVVGNILSKISSPQPLPTFPTQIKEGSIWVEVDG